LSHGRAIELLQEKSGRAYDPELVQLFVRLVERVHAQPEQVLTPRFPALVRAGWLAEARAAI
jgi:HD-GYP domain-containing protein (c-di-GMP phosphodiesterase class II)